MLRITINPYIEKTDSDRHCILIVRRMPNLNVVGAAIPEPFDVTC